MPLLFVKSDDCQQISAKIHNRKCTLLVRLERAKTPTKLLFVEFKAVLYVKVWCRDKKKRFSCHANARLVENGCVAERTAGLLETDRQDWDSFIYL